MEYLDHVGLGHVPRLTRIEWGVIRRYLIWNAYMCNSSNTIMTLSIKSIRDLKPFICLHLLHKLLG